MMKMKMSFLHITQARVHDMNAMDDIPYEPNAYYIFDRGYFDLERLFTVNLIGSYFVIRQRGHLQHEIVEGEDLLEGPDNILFDQTIRLTGQQTGKKYPCLLRHIVYYSTEHNRSFTYLTDRFEVKAEYIALLYKNRWQVEWFLVDKTTSACKVFPGNYRICRQNTNIFGNHGILSCCHYRT